MMKQRSLTTLLMSRFAVFMIALLILAAPLFYLIFVNYYREDLAELATIAHIPASELDLEKDTFIGLLLQLLAFVILLGVSVFLFIRFVQMRMWQPFNDTLRQLGRFKVEDGMVPAFAPTAVREFTELNTTLDRILNHSVGSYRVQKQFTENASHELQTPLAIAQGKMDLLLQTQDLTEEQVSLMQDVYHELTRMSRLNRNLLLLAKIGNAQYRLSDRVVLADKLDAMIPSLELLAGNIAISTHLVDRQMTVACNEVLLESMVNNLVVNAVRHNRPNGQITITLDRRMLTIANTSDEPPLDSQHIFERFYRNNDRQHGNGLGLAIVKSICEYHHWTIAYRHESPNHIFTVQF